MCLVRIFISTLIFIFSIHVSAFEAGETVRLHGQLNEDTYAAGGNIFSSAAIAGDLVTSGGTIIIDGSVQSDVLVFGGDVTITADIGDDLRIMAGSTLIKSNISGDLLFAGGQLSISPNSIIKGSARLAGGQLDINGQIHKNLNAVGGIISISGHLHGDVELDAENIRIESTAIIDGNLSYRSEHQAVIHPDAKIAGAITYDLREPDKVHKGPGIFILFTLMIGAMVFFMLFPDYSKSSSELLYKEYWKGLGIGLVMLLVVPFVAIFSIALVVGIWLGLILLLLYAVALFIGSFIGMIFSAQTFARLIHFELSSTGKQLLAIIIAYVLLGLLQYVPILGGLAGFIIMLGGLGAGSIVLFRSYTGNNANAA